jgi:twitching motility protein PilT
MDIDELLLKGIECQASDVHLVAGIPPIMRVHGILVPIRDSAPLTGDDIQDMFEHMADAQGRERFAKTFELDFAHVIPDAGRFRVNVARQMNTTSMVIRILPPVIPDIDALGVPVVCKELILRPNGMIVISGPTGSGKSTTLAAMINFLNRGKIGNGRRVVTVEDPIEYAYQSENCIITQRELGGDTTSFVEALRHVLRQDPDVILIGEMRDTETAAAALTIAETGHLVLTTGHAPSSPGAIERIIDLFPPHERTLVQSRLSTLLQAVFCQALVPRVDKPGRVPAVEVMLANTAVRNIIREGKIYQLPNVIRTHQAEGMQLMDHALVKLYGDGKISSQGLFTYCNNRDEVERTIDKTSAAVQKEPRPLAPAGI